MTTGGIGSGQNDPAWVLAARRALARLTGKGEAAAYRVIQGKQGSGVVRGLQNVRRNVNSLFRK